MKKVLVLSFFWPPSGKASLHWPLKMVKFLPEYGWQPSVLTVKEDTFTAPDNSLLKEVSPDLPVYKTGFLDPFDLYRKLLGKKKGEVLSASEALSKTDSSFKQRLAIWFRMTFFIPDARIGWYLPGLKEAKKLLKKEKFDVILTNGPPHSVHLLGKKLSSLFKLPLVSVFIDPWVDISYYKGHKRNKAVLAIDNHLEKSVIKLSSKIVFVTQGLIDYFSDKYPQEKEKYRLLYWGYNEDDFEDLEPLKRDYHTILHAGNIFDHQNPKYFWPAVKEKIDSGASLRLKFVGTVSPLIKQEIEKNGLLPYTDYSGFLPYKDMLREMISAEYLLVCATEPRHVPGKLFEYIRTGNRVIAFGDDNDEVAEILNKTGVGRLFSYSDSASEVFSIQDRRSADFEEIRKFDRKNITRGLSEILEEVT